MLELGGSDLRVHGRRGRDACSPLSAVAEVDAAPALHAATEGWPAAVRLAVETLRELPSDGLGTRRSSACGGPAGRSTPTSPPRSSRASRLRCGSSSARSRRSSAFTRRAVRDARDRQCRGDPRRARPPRALRRAARHAGSAGSRSTPLVRDFAARSPRLPPSAEHGGPSCSAAAWLEHARRRRRAPCGCSQTPARPTAIAGLLARCRGRRCSRGGAVEIGRPRQRARCPRDLRDAASPSARGAGAPGARRLGGRARAASSRRAAGATSLPRPRLADGPHPPPARTARRGARHLRARPARRRREPRDEALLLAWTASARWLRGDAEALPRRRRSVHSRSPRRRATRRRSPPRTRCWRCWRRSRATAAQTTRTTSARSTSRSRAGDVLQLIRVRTNRGSRHVEEGAYEEAIAELEIALELADVAGFASFRALALTNRGEARCHLGQARGGDRRSRGGPAPLPAARLADGRLPAREARRGVLASAATSLSLAPPTKRRSRRPRRPDDIQGLVPALAGLARVLAVRRAGDGRARWRGVPSPHGARDGLRRRAPRRRAGSRSRAGDRSCGRVRRRGGHGGARSAATAPGWRTRSSCSALAADEPDAPSARGSRRRPPLWRDVREPARRGPSRVRSCALPRGGTTARAERRRRAPARRSARAATAAHLARLLRRLDEAAPPVAVQTLGRFRVLRDGEAVPLDRLAVEEGARPAQDPRRPARPARRRATF